jgi:hypothetical protein
MLIFNEAQIFNLWRCSYPNSECPFVLHFDHPEIAIRISGFKLRRAEPILFFYWGKIGNSCRLIKESNEDINPIGRASGFNGLSNFRKITTNGHD